MKRLAALVLFALASLPPAGCEQASTAPRRTASRTLPRAAVPTIIASSPNRVVVYYLHRKFHCPSCEWIENTTRQTLRDTFPSELASGRLTFQEDLARQYDVQGISVVVYNRTNGREVSLQHLEKVWDLKMQNDEFRAYVTDMVRAALNRAT